MITVAIARQLLASVKALLVLTVLVGVIYPAAILAVGIALGALIGTAQGYIVAYVGVPAFIVTLGGYLAWRGMIFRVGIGVLSRLIPQIQVFFVALPLQMMGGLVVFALGLSTGMLIWLDSLERYATWLR